MPLIAFFNARISFCLRFNSPGSQRWQNSHFTPFKQPRLLKACAHGLQMPKWWHADPTVGRFAEPKAKASGTAASRLNRRGFWLTESANACSTNCSCKCNAAVPTLTAVSESAVLQQPDPLVSEPDASTSGAASLFAELATANGGMTVCPKRPGGGVKITHGNNDVHFDADCCNLSSLTTTSLRTRGLEFGICCVRPNGSVAKRC
mmetsp:Transcript_134001/g.267406  ORF Transcript_134001/g.267406 Transcript_134001/m.267406 type:complete len:205 (-) Transcript_134001:84-698(-)